MAPLNHSLHRTAFLSGRPLSQMLPNSEVIVQRGITVLLDRRDESNPKRRKWSLGNYRTD